MQTRTIIDKLLLGLSISAGLPLALWAVDAPLAFLQWLRGLTIVSGCVTLLLFAGALGLRRRLAYSRYQYATGFDRIVRLHGLRFFLWFLAHHSVWIAVGGLLVTMLLTLAGIYRWTLAISVSLVMAMLYLFGGLVYSLFFLFDRRLRTLGICWQHPADHALSDWTTLGALILLQNRFEQSATRDLQQPASLLRRLIAILDLAQAAGADRPIHLLEPNVGIAAAQEARVRGMVFTAVFASSLVVMLLSLATGIVAPVRPPSPASVIAMLPNGATAAALAVTETTSPTILAPVPTATPTASTTPIAALLTPTASRLSAGMPVATASGVAGTPSPASTPGAAPTDSRAPAKVNTPDANGQSTIAAPSTMPAGTPASAQNGQTPTPDHQTPHVVESTAVAPSDARTVTITPANVGQSITNTESANANRQATAAAGTTIDEPVSTPPTPMTPAAPANSSGGQANATPPAPNGQLSSSDQAATGATAGPPPASPPADSTPSTASTGTAKGGTPNPDQPPVATGATTPNAANGTPRATSMPGATPASGSQGSVDGSETPKPDQPPSSSAAPAATGTPSAPGAPASVTVTPGTSGNDPSADGTPPPNDAAANPSLAATTPAGESAAAGASGTPHPTGSLDGTSNPNPQSTAAPGSTTTVTTASADPSSATTTPAGGSTAAGASGTLHPTGQATAEPGTAAPGQNGAAANATATMSTPSSGNAAGAAQTPDPNRQATTAPGATASAGSGTTPAASAPGATAQAGESGAGATNQGEPTAGTPPPNAAGGNQAQGGQPAGDSSPTDASVPNSDPGQAPGAAPSGLPQPQDGTPAATPANGNQPTPAPSVEGASEETGASSDSQGSGSSKNGDLTGAFSPEVAAESVAEQQAGDIDPNLTRPASLDAIAQAPPPPTDSSQILSIEIPPMTQLYGTESAGEVSAGNETPDSTAPPTLIDIAADNAGQPEDPVTPTQYLPNWIRAVFQQSEPPR